jgi:putative Holliday junction resolvase
VRALGVDLGTRRIGLAVSDPTGTLASPYGVIQRSGDRATDHARLAEVIAELEVEVVVVGLPLSLSGKEGPAAQAALAEVDEIRARMTLEVLTHDERLTTVEASRALRASGASGRARRSQRAKGVIDSAAAAVLLQSWLDGRSRRVEQ